MDTDTTSDGARPMVVLLASKMGMEAMQRSGWRIWLNVTLNPAHSVETLLKVYIRPPWEFSLPSSLFNNSTSFI